MSTLPTYSDDLGHLARLDRPVAVDVVHLERPLELLLRFPGRRDVDRLQELLEVDLAAVVRVERPEHVLAELVGVALREETRVDLEELVSRQLTVRAVSLCTHKHAPYLVSAAKNIVPLRNKIEHRLKIDSVRFCRKANQARFY